MINKKVSLMVFLKGSSDPEVRMPGCASYYENNCVYDKPCLVENGKRCAYFEKAVLPTAADCGQREHIYDLYKNQTGAMCKMSTEKNKIRSCPDCGQELRYRQRYCDACAKTRDRASRKAAAKKVRATQRPSTSTISIT